MQLRQRYRTTPKIEIVEAERELGEPGSEFQAIVLLPDGCEVAGRLARF